MLPIQSTPARRHIVAAGLALALSLPAAPSHAWGQHEQGIVAGALGLLAVQGLMRASKNAQAAAPVSPHVPAPYVPAPVYTPQKPVTYAPKPVAATRTPAAYAFTSYSSGERRAIQRSLARAGYYNGTIDGTFGRGTYNATAAFARDTGASAALTSQAGAFGLYDRLLYGAH